jgi:altronate hydrolase
MKGFLVIHHDDNVGVALKKLDKGSRISYQSQDIPVLEDIEPGHKIALTDIREGDHVIKYGFPIGNASRFIAKGSYVHLHNLKSAY